MNERLLPSVLLLSATARAVVETPELNGFWIDGAFRAGGRVHLGCRDLAARRRPDRAGAPRC